MALVEQVTATKDRNKRQQCHINALEYRCVSLLALFLSTLWLLFICFLLVNFTV